MLKTDQSESRIRAFAECGSRATIMRANDDPDRFRIAASHCHDRLCTPCAVARSYQIREALRHHVADRPITFLTLTIRHRDEPLTELIDRLYLFFRALRRQPLWDDKVQGGACFLEVKRDANNTGWHPHLHIVMDAAYIDVARLKAAWMAITAGSHHINIQRSGDTKTVTGYITKYVTKSLDGTFAMVPAWLNEAVTALRGRRLCLCFGTWYGTPLNLALDTELADDLVDAGGWHYFMDLNDLLQRADEGERDAWGMIDQFRLREPLLRMLASGP